VVTAEWVVTVEHQAQVNQVVLQQRQPELEAQVALGLLRLEEDS
jgi:hypothetical protein